jgi:hypothetical protein
MAEIIELAAYRQREQLKASQEQWAATLEMIEEQVERLLAAVGTLPPHEQWAVEVEAGKWSDLAYLMRGGDPCAMHRKIVAMFDA